MAHTRPQSTPSDSEDYLETLASRSERDYLTALQEISALIDTDPMAESTDGKRLSVLGAIVQEYEAKHFPVALPTPLEAIEFRIEQSFPT